MGNQVGAMTGEGTVVQKSRKSDSRTSFGDTYTLKKKKHKVARTSVPGIENFLLCCWSGDPGFPTKQHVIAIAFICL